MRDVGGEKGLLSSWKEIADYLGCDRRTCLRWEANLGLPIHRMKGISRSRVFAYKEELNTWRRQALGKNLGDIAKGPSESCVVSKRSKRGYYWFLPVFTCIIIAIVIGRTGSDQPANFKILGSRLVILDKDGIERWHFDTNIENLQSERVYKNQFMIRKPSPQGRPLLPLVIIKDINQDNKKEVLFSTKTLDEYGEGELYCFSNKGRQLWRFKEWPELQFGEKVYSPDYRIMGFEASDINDDGRSEILIIAAHMQDFPSMLVVLNHQGKKIGEFTNCGRIHDLAYADLERGGSKELLIAGVNNEYGKGFLAVFDTALIKGCSPQQGPEYISKDLGEGSERYYVLFPRTDVDIVENWMMEGLETIHILKNHRIRLEPSHSQISFELDSKMRILDVKDSHVFENKHREFLASGKIKSTLNDEYWNSLRRGLQYWDGKGWTLIPTVNLLKN